MTLSPARWSSVSKKLITGITGLGLVLFVIAHLTGNLTLLLGPEAFNAYAHFLHSLFHGWFVYIADLGLIVFFAAHAVAGLHVWYKRRKARPQRYAVRGSAGGPSRRTLASSTMALSGLFLLVFLIFHVQHFKFGPQYTTMLHGEEVRDLYRLVAEEFQKPVIVISYVGFMVLLGMHLRHGVWSMLQSLGALNRRYLPLAYSSAAVIAALLAIGFIVLPIALYFVGDPTQVAILQGVMP